MLMVDTEGPTQNLTIDENTIFEKKAKQFGQQAIADMFMRRALYIIKFIPFHQHASPHSPTTTGAPD